MNLYYQQLNTSQLSDSLKLSQTLKLSNSSFILNMSTSDIKARTELFALLDIYGSAWILNATANWIGGNTSSGKETKKLKKRKASPKTKAGLLEAIEETYPDWNLVSPP